MHNFVQMVVLVPLSLLPLLYLQEIMVVLKLNNKTVSSPCGRAEVSLGASPHSRGIIAD